MSRNYDNWERLVAAVLDREHLRYLAMCHSRDPSTISSDFSSFRSSSRRDDFANYYNEATSQSSEDAWEIIWQSLSDYEMSGSGIDKRTGKVCYAVGAQQLHIAWGDTPRYWKWKTDSNSRFPKVAVLEIVWWLDVCAIINTRKLSPNTTYVAYLVYKLDEKSWGLDTADIYVRFTANELRTNAENRAQNVELQTVTEERSDGWKEVAIGNFHTGTADNREVEARFMNIKARTKSGLIVESIEFRPANYSEIGSNKNDIVKRKGLLYRLWTPKIGRKVN